jgi:uncharacterized protein (TIGR03083 family)
MLPPAPLTYDEAVDLADAEHHRFLTVLASLRDVDGNGPTDCDGWTVRDIAGHVLGSMHDNASLVRTLRAWRQAQRVARRHGTDTLDESTAAQIRAFADLPSAEIATTFETLAPRNVSGRRRIPRTVRHAPITVQGHRYTLGYITGIVLTRDVWMHRIDLCRATQRELMLTADHDGRIVAGVVSDWTRAHHQPFALTLGGSAGCAWSTGENGEILQLDAVEFCRILSGRANGTNLLTQPVLF